MSRYSGVGLALLLSCRTLPSPALACVVGTGTGESCTESALNACLPGCGSFDRTETFNCGCAATTIDSESLITISRGNSLGVFFVNAGVTFTVRNLTIANGNSPSVGGNIFNNTGGTPTVTNSTLAGDSADGGSGGALRRVFGNPATALR